MAEHGPRKDGARRERKPMLEPRKASVGHERERRGGTGPCEVVVLSTMDSPRKMYSPSPPAPIAAAIVAVPTRSPWHAEPGHDGGERKRELDHEQQRREVIPMATPASTTFRSRLCSPRTVVPDDRQQRVQGGVTSAVRGPPRDERKGKQEAEQCRLGSSARRSRQTEAADRAVGRRNARIPAGIPRVAPLRSRSGPVHVLLDQPRELGPVRHPEMKQLAHDVPSDRAGPSVSRSTVTRGSRDRATASGESHTTS